MLGLMTRVVLRHTGRPLAAPRWLHWACLAMIAATLLRLASAIWGLGDWAIALAAVVWAAPFLAFAVVHALALLGPSLPRSQTGARRT